MSEFNATPEARLVADGPEATRRESGGLGWLQRPLLLGLSLPWLIAALLVIAAAGWYLFAPDSQPTTNRLAFPENEGFETVAKPAPEAQASSDGASGSDLYQLKEEVASMVGGVTLGLYNQAFHVYFLEIVAVVSKSCRLGGVTVG